MKKQFFGPKAGHQQRPTIVPPKAEDFNISDEGDEIRTNLRTVRSISAFSSKPKFGHRVSKTDYPDRPGGGFLSLSDNKEHPEEALRILHERYMLEKSRGMDWGGVGSDRSYQLDRMFVNTIEEAKNIHSQDHSRYNRDLSNLKQPLDIELQAIPRYSRGFQFFQELSNLLGTMSEKTFNGNRGFSEGDLNEIAISLEKKLESKQNCLDKLRMTIEVDQNKPE